MCNCPSITAGGSTAGQRKRWRAEPAAVNPGRGDRLLPGAERTGPGAEVRQRQVLDHSRRGTRRSATPCGRPRSSEIKRQRHVAERLAVHERGSRPAASLRQAAGRARWPSPSRRQCSSRRSSPRPNAGLAHRLVHAEMRKTASGTTTKHHPERRAVDDHGTAARVGRHALAKVQVEVERAATSAMAPCPTAWPGAARVTRATAPGGPPAPPGRDHQQARAPIRARRIARRHRQTMSTRSACRTATSDHGVAPGSAT